MKYQSKSYQCEAFKIVSVSPEYHIEGKPNEITVDITLDNGECRTLEPGQISRMIPEPGDYYVIATNPDGSKYPYLNPKAVFESKYEPVTT